MTFLKTGWTAYGDPPWFAHLHSKTGERLPAWPLKASGQLIYCLWLKRRIFILHIWPLESEIFRGLIIPPVPSKTEKTPGQGNCISKAQGLL